MSFLQPVPQHEREQLDALVDKAVDRLLALQALSTLVEAKPYLADRRPRGDVDQGAREQPRDGRPGRYARGRAG